MSERGPSEHSSESSSNMPGCRTLLVGMHSTVADWMHALTAIEPQQRIVGCLLPAGSQTASHASRLPAILGAWDKLEAVVVNENIQQIYLTLPAAMIDQARVLARRMDPLGVTWRFLPALSDQLAGRSAAALKPAAAASMEGLVVDPTQLIARQPRALDEAAIRRTLQGKTVLITGSGGSIGSELARLVAGFNPARLVLVERSENALFEIDRQIARLFPQLSRAAVLHDVTNVSRTLGMVMAQKPQVIFHAAAHKHVPMMEEHPADAVENNFYGTRSIADAAAAQGVERFVMISSDKAVNPSSVMGATKRLAELYIQDLNRRSDTTFSMVRFGNVLGSACSVIPIWSQQLAHGGPITVTSSDMVRYFMTIPEAAGLVLQSAALAGGDGQGAGEVFLLDMGKPVRILDLAKRFIQAQGLEPGVDVEIQITGVRPGEKLFEELAYSGEDMLPTAHQSIHIWRSAQPIEARRMKEIVRLFDELRHAGQPDHPWQHVTAQDIQAALRQAIPEMVTPAPTGSMGSTTQAVRISA